jgi:hypothetical protein
MLDDAVDRRRDGLGLADVGDDRQAIAGGGGGGELHGHAIASASPRPIPVPPPVMRATLPSNRSSRKMFIERTSIEAP